MLARSPTQTSWSLPAVPRYSRSSGRSPRTVASGPSTARMISATVTSIGRPGEPVAALGAALALHEAGVPQLAEDVLEESQRDSLRLRDPIALQRPLLVGRGERDRGADGVVGFGGDPHRPPIVPTCRARCLPASQSA